MKLSYILVSIVFLFSVDVHAQEVIQLIGLERDSSSLSQQSYSVMYDHSNDPVFEGKYMPYQTVMVQRKGDTVKICSQNFLIVPTVKGFRYVTQSVVETPNVDEGELEFEALYKLRSTNSTPCFFDSKQKVKDLIVSENPSFQDAIDINFERISFISPNFYVTEGFDSEVHGGATWFNASEKSKLYKLNPQFAIFSNKLVDYLDRSKVNQIIIEAVKSSYGDESDIDEDYLLPWGGPINKHDNVYFTLVYQNNQVYIVPLTLINGNSARSFLVEGKPFQDKSLLDKLGIKNNLVPTAKNLEFLSPDKSTRTLIENNVIKVYDQKEGRLLLERSFPKFNKLIMSEWALGGYVDKWSAEF